MPVGNVMDTTKLMYEFSSSESNWLNSVLAKGYYYALFYHAENVDIKDVQEVPFQVQIKYTSLDGQQCLRVFTEARPTTSDKGVADEGIHYHELHSCSSQ